jgi:hypothetical protein
VIWVRSALLALRQEESRRERLAAAIGDLTDLKRRLRSPKSRLRASCAVLVTPPSRVTLRGLRRLAPPPRTTPAPVAQRA